MDLPVTSRGDGHYLILHLVNKKRFGVRTLKRGPAYHFASTLRRGHHDNTTRVITESLGGLATNCAYVISPSTAEISYTKKRRKTAIMQVYLSGDAENIQNGHIRSYHGHRGKFES